MLNPLSDCLLRIANADGPELKLIFQHEIAIKIWDESERQILTNAFENRAAALNKEALGIAVPRWK